MGFAIVRCLTDVRFLLDQPSGNNTSHPSRRAEKGGADVSPSAHLGSVDGVGVIGDEKGVHVVRAGEVVSSPPGAWHWHGATPATAMTHLTVEKPGDFDLDVDRRDWDITYGPELGA